MSETILTEGELKGIVRETLQPSLDELHAEWKSALEERLTPIERTLAAQSRLEFGPPLNASDVELEFTDKHGPAGMFGRLGQAHDRVMLESVAFGKAPRDCPSWRLPGVQKALDSVTAGSGAEWINPATLSGEFVLRAQAKTEVFRAFRSETLSQREHRVPVEGDEPSVEYFGENASLTTTVTASSPGTDEVTLRGDKVIAGRVLFSQQYEDFEQAIATRVREQQLIRAAAKGLDQALLNGDTAVTHIDTDVTDANDVRKLANGLRKKALTDSGANVSLATFTAEGLAEILAGMGDFADDPEEGLWLFASRTYLSRLLFLKDAANERAFFPSRMDDNPVVTGQVGTLFGAPVMKTGRIRTNLDATGVYAADGTKTVCHYVWRPSVVVGLRGTATLTRVAIPRSNAVEIVMTMNADCACAHDGETSVAMGYAID